MRILSRTAFQAQTGIPPIWLSGQLPDSWLIYDGLSFPLLRAWREWQP